MSTQEPVAVVEERPANDSPTIGSDGQDAALAESFSAVKSQGSSGESSCCSSAEQASCCEPSAKASCCGPSMGGGCGCR